MNSVEPLKTKWTWEEWQAMRQARRALSLRVGRPVCRRKESSSDARLQAAFSGQRVPSDVRNASK
ncbi:MAG: hypothetical protein PHG96_08265 [Kiritimatiellae bacterium]|nr:hypothetical protein [Kiritimatiellia bacterium]MDD3545335.1 hypothetical protein [Kiritimatiellia bacterium]MDD4025051.1 hypothetical protein [Kiritimatiellia bacterium]